MKRIARSACLVAFLLSTAACQRESATSTPPSSASAASTDAARQPVQAAANAFTVEIALSPAARERLVSKQESLIATAEYFGYPSERAVSERVPGSENPWLTLHRAQVELEVAQLDDTATARFPAVALDPGQLAWTVAPDAPQVNINVYSGRRSAPDNLLDCGMFQDALAVALRAPVRISCGLISEPGSR